jgi:tRNA modification GTPase
VSTQTKSDTIVAIATPTGRGGVGIVRVSGARVRAIVQSLCGDLRARSAKHVQFRDADDDIIDDGLALFFPSPHSYTGEDTLELHGHGSPHLLAALVARCIECGGAHTRHAQPGEFTQRAFLNGKLDLAQAEAVADAIDAGSAAAARAAVQALTGAFSAHIKTLQDKLIRLRMFTEATLDFPEEDVDFLQAENARGQARDVIAALEAVLAQAQQGQLLHDGVRIVLVGAPNVGKSSLLNRLAGEELAIVTPIAGTTRDTVRARVSLRGLPCEMIDTAGVRATDDPVEKLGIERTLAAVARADCVLLISDVTSETSVAVPKVVRAHLPASVPIIHVRNKVDQLSSQNALFVPTPQMPHAVSVSAHTGAGIDALISAIIGLVGYAGETQGAFTARARHVDALKRARAHLQDALKQIEIPALELFAEELRLAHRALGEIVGEFTPDDLLGEIFGKFCIGK